MSISARITRWILRDQYFTGPVTRSISYAKRSFCLRSKRVGRHLEPRSIRGRKRERGRERERERGHVARFDGGRDAWRNNGGGNGGSERENTRYFTLPSW